MKSRCLWAWVVLGLGSSVGLGQTPVGLEGKVAIIAHSPARTRQYIGSPSLATLGGELLASHDFFGPGSTRDTTRVYASKDGGQSWSRRAEIVGQWWSTLFTHRGALYLMGTSREYGHAVIRRSTDAGQTWTTPRDAASGLLLADGKYHCAPVPVLAHGGRLWRAMEDAMGPGGWGSHFRCFMMSIPEDADLLQASHWTVSARLPRNPEWLHRRFGGWLEGNAVLTPAGDVVDVLRVDSRDPTEKAALVRVSPDGRSLRFDPERDMIDFPGGCKKFTIRWDPASRLYWTLCNWVQEEKRMGEPGRNRNTLALARSADLRQWEVRGVILSHPDSLTHGYQYVDWLFDGDDLLAVVRMAHDDGLGGGHNAHDANFLAFLRVPGFRARTMADPPLSPR